MSGPWTPEKAADARQRRLRQLATNPPCTVDQCDRPLRVNDVCEMHWIRMNRHGSYDLRPTIVADRFWDKVTTSQAGECWEWKGSRNKYGYGRFTLTDKPTVRLLSHRMAYILSTGEDVRGLVVRHTCDNPPCCNPAHLIPGSLADNVADMHNRGRVNLSGLALGGRRRSA